MMTFEYYYLIQDLTGVITTFFSLRLISVLLRSAVCEGDVKYRVLFFQVITFTVGMTMLCLPFSIGICTGGLGIILYLKYVSKQALEKALIIQSKKQSKAY